MSRFRTILMWTGLGLLVVLVAIQFVPYGRDHTNPASGREIAWDVPLWQHALAVLLVLVTIYALVRFAGRVYAHGLLHGGSRLGVRAAWRVARQH